MALMLCSQLRVSMILTDLVLGCSHDDTNKLHLDQRFDEHMTCN